ncbi:MAG: hypothetical protein IJR89_05915 [Clostridia bacterium]|nr:hypothetical protein [Clostridia bacterium]
MTADLSLNKTRRVPFFWRQFLSQKTALILSVLIFFLSMSVPMLSAVSERWDGAEITETEKTFSLFESVLGIVSVSTFLLMALTALSAALAFGIYADRKSAYYYGALPVSRDALFCQRTLAGFLAPLPGYLVNFLLVLAMLLTSPLDVGPIVPMLFAYTGYALLFCFATYAVCVFAASLTSNKIGTLLLSGYLFLLAPVHLGLARLLTEEFLPSGRSFSFFRGDGLCEAIINRSSPAAIAIRFFNEAENQTRTWVYELDGGRERSYAECMKLVSLPAAETVLLVVISLLLLLAALLIHRRRPAENAGETFAFPRVGEVIKYSILVSCGAAFGLFFEALLFDTLIAFFFGAVFGVVFGAVILNLVIYRTPKKIFYKPKRLLVFTAILLAVFLLAAILCNQTGIFRFTAENVATVSFEYGDPIPPEQLDRQLLLKVLEQWEKASDYAEYDKTVYVPISVELTSRRGLIERRYVPLTRYYIEQLSPYFGSEYSIAEIEEKYAYYSETASY